jgi:hypothetical protein
VKNGLLGFFGSLLKKHTFVGGVIGIDDQPVIVIFLRIGNVLGKAEPFRPPRPAVS